MQDMRRNEEVSIMNLQIIKGPFTLYTDRIKENAMRAIEAINTDGEPMVISIKPLKKDKSLAQLGALFGLWATQIQEETGEDKMTFHKKMKASFLAPIYCADPQGPLQESWVELLAVYQERGEFEKFEYHVEHRLSLSWASINQMTRYMNDIYAYYTSNGVPLAIPDKFIKVMR